MYSRLDTPEIRVRIRVVCIALTAFGSGSRSGYANTPIARIDLRLRVRGLVRLGRTRRLVGLRTLMY